ncbi:hypothetical protein RCL1_005107 [Eukaryota sp. TZLM3-RCL]
MKLLILVLLVSLCLAIEHPHHHPSHGFLKNSFRKLKNFSQKNDDKQSSDHHHHKHHKHHHRHIRRLHSEISSLITQFPESSPIEIVTQFCESHKDRKRLQHHCDTCLLPSADELVSQIKNGAKPRELKQVFRRCYPEKVQSASREEKKPHLLSFLRV